LPSKYLTKEALGEVLNFKIGEEVISNVKYADGFVLTG
jgi:hypothetical protein